MLTAASRAIIVQVALVREAEKTLKRISAYFHVWAKVRSFIVGTLPQEQFTLLTDYDPDSPYVVAYQTVYANIRSNWDSEHNRQHAISLTTPATYKGQAAVAANIAITAAQSGTPRPTCTRCLYPASISFAVEKRFPRHRKEIGCSLQSCGISWSVCASF